MTMIHWRIDDYYRTVAKENSSTKAYNRHSIKKGEGNELGLLGEICYLKLLECIYPSDIIVYQPNFEYDITIDTAKVDVKSKERNVPPRGFYAASVAAYKQQDCDLYAFTSITVDKQTNKYTDFYYLGHMSKQEYFERATFMKEGEPDGNNMRWNKKTKQFEPFLITEDCYNLEYKHLTQFSPETYPALKADGFEIIPF